MLRTLTLLTLTGLTGLAHARSYTDIKIAGTIRIATSADFVPFNYQENGQYKGFEVEVANAVIKRMGLKAQWQKDNFDALLNGLRADKYDLVIASHAITKDRENLVSFTAPHYCTGGVILTRTGGPRKATDLKGKRVATESGSTYFAYVRNLSFQKSIKVYPDSQKAIYAFLVNYADAVVTDKFVALDAVKNTSGGKLQSSPLLWTERIGMAVQKGNTELQAAANAALAGIIKDGTYAKLSRQYFGEDIGCK